MVDTVNDSNPRLRHAYRWENRVNGGDFLMMLLKCVQITIHHAVLRAHLHGIKKLQTVLRYRKYQPRIAALFNFCMTEGQNGNFDLMVQESTRGAGIDSGAGIDLI